MREEVAIELAITLWWIIERGVKLRIQWLIDSVDLHCGLEEDLLEYSPAGC